MVTQPPEESLLKIGDVAKQTGTTLRALRYYEELNLIEPTNRSKGNFRLYDPKVIEKIEFINSLKKLDFSLEEILDLLGPADGYKTDRDIVDRTRNALMVKKQKITEKLIELATMNREVEHSLAILNDCVTCKDENQNAPCEITCESKHVHIE